MKYSFLIVNILILIVSVYGYTVLYDGLERCVLFQGILDMEKRGCISEITDLSISNEVLYGIHNQEPIKGTNLNFFYRNGSNLYLNILKYAAGTDTVNNYICSDQYMPIGYAAMENGTSLTLLYDTNNKVVIERWSEDIITTQNFTGVWTSNLEQLGLIDSIYHGAISAKKDGSGFIVAVLKKNNIENAIVQLNGQGQVEILNMTIPSGTIHYLKEYRIENTDIIQIATDTKLYNCIVQLGTCHPKDVLNLGETFWAQMIHQFEEYQYIMKMSLFQTVHIFQNTMEEIISNSSISFSVKSLDTFGIPLFMMEFPQIKSTKLITNTSVGFYLHDQSSDQGPFFPMYSVLPVAYPSQTIAPLNLPLGTTQIQQQYQLENRSSVILTHIQNYYFGEVYYIQEECLPNQYHTTPLSTNFTKGDVLIMGKEALSTCSDYECNGLLGSMGCSNRGNCTAENTCACEASYYGNACQDYQCNGVHHNDSAVCGGHGLCVDSDVCQCDPTFVHYNNSCQYQGCFGIPMHFDTSCKGHGECDPILNTCQCEEGYNGLECGMWHCNSLPKVNPNVCSKNGECIGPNQCSCEEGYIGQFCNTPICYGIPGNESTVCSGHGTCSSINICQCDDEWNRQDCSLKAYELQVSVTPQVATLCSPIEIDLSNTQTNDGSPIELSYFSSAEELLEDLPSDKMTFSLSSASLPLGETTLQIIAKSVSTGIDYEISKTITLRKVNFNAPSPYIKGGNDKIVYVNEYINVAGSAVYNPNCGDLILPEKVVFEWKQLETNNASSHYVIGDGVDARFLTFPQGLPHEFEGSTLSFQLTVYPAGNPTMNVSTIVNIEIKIRDLQASIVGGSRDVNRFPNITSKGITFEGIFTDPSFTNESEHITWTSSTNLTVHENQKMVTLYPLETQTTIMLFLDYQKGARLVRRFVRINVLDNIINCWIELYGPNQPLQNENFVLIAKSDTNDEALNYQWSIESETSKDINNIIIGSSTNRMLVVDGSKVGDISLFNVTMMDQKTNKTGSANFKVQYTLLPTPGLVKITPSEGSAYNTTFKIQLSKFQSQNEPLKYALSIVDQGKIKPLLLPSYSTTINVKLPPGDPTQNDTLSLVISAYEGRAKVTVNLKAVVRPPTGAISSIDSLLNSTNDLEANFGMNSEEQLLRISQIANIAQLNYKNTKENYSQVRSKSANLMIKIVNAVHMEKNAQLVSQVGTISNVLSSSVEDLDDDTQHSLVDLVANMTKDGFTEEVIGEESLSTLLDTVSNIATYLFSTNGRADTKLQIGESMNNIGHLALKLALPNAPPIQIESGISKVSTERFVPTNQNYNRQLGNQSLSFVPEFSKQFTNLTDKIRDDGLGIILRHTNVNAHDFLDKNKSDLATPLFSVQFNVDSETLALRHLSVPFEFDLKLNASINTYKMNNRNPVCSYWDPERQLYSSDGCTLVSVNDTNIKCSCNHTTDFGVILSYIPKFNLLTDEDFITNLNPDNMTTAIVLGVMISAYFVIMLLMQILDCILLARIKKLKRQGKFKDLDKVKFGQLNQVGEPQYLWPLWVKFRESHLWFAVVFSRISEQQTFTKQQRLTILVVLILSIFFSNALTVGLGDENETEYVIAAFVADFFTQPFSLILAFLFAKLKPNKSEQELLQSIREELEIEKQKLKKQHEMKEASTTHCEKVDQVEQSIVADSFMPKENSMKNNFATYKWKLEQQGDQTAFKILCTILQGNEYFVLTKDIDSLILYTYSLETGKWSLIPTKGKIPNDTDTDYHCLFHEHQFIVFWTTYDEKHHAFISVSSLDTELLTWSQLNCSNSPNLEQGYSLTHFENRVFVFGGVSELQEHSNTIFSFNLNTMHWKGLLVEGDIPSPRLNHAACKVNGQDILIHGGQNMSTFYNDVYLYNTQTGIWQQLDLDPSHLNPEERAGHSVTVVPNDDATLISIFGGFNDMEIFNDLHMFVLESRQWFELKPLNEFETNRFVPEKNFNHDMVAYKQNLYVFGGITKPHLLSCHIDQIQLTEEALSLSSLSSNNDGRNDTSKLVPSKLVDQEAVSKNILQTRSLVNGVVHEVDKRIHKVVSKVKTKNARLFGIIALIVSSIVYFGLTALGCYLMLLIQWLGPIGTSTYGALAVVSYITLIMQIYLTAKRKMYIRGKIRWKTRFTIVNVNLTLIALLLIAISLCGSMYGVSTIEDESLRIGMYVIMVAFHFGLFLNAITWLFHIFVSPRRKKTAVEGFLSRAWFPHWFKYFIYMGSWGFMAGLGVVLVMYGIRFNRIEGSEYNWYMACFFGNSQNFLLDEMLAFIASSIIFVAIARLFEIFLFPREIIIGAEESDEEDNIQGDLDIPDRFRNRGKKSPRLPVLGSLFTRTQKNTHKPTMVVVHVSDTDEDDEESFDFFETGSNVSDNITIKPKTQNKPEVKHIRIEPTPSKQPGSQPQTNHSNVDFQLQNHNPTNADSDDSFVDEPTPGTNFLNSEMPLYD